MKNKQETAETLYPLLTPILHIHTYPNTCNNANGYNPDRNIADAEFIHVVSIRTVATRAQDIIVPMISVLFQLDLEN